MPRMNHDRSKNIMPSCTILNRSACCSIQRVEMGEVLRRGQVGKLVAGQARLRERRPFEPQLRPAANRRPILIDVVVAVVFDRQRRHFGHRRVAAGEGPRRARRADEVLRSDTARPAARTIASSIQI